jgi:hypothetical protein
VATGRMPSAVFSSSVASGSVFPVAIVIGSTLSQVAGYDGRHIDDRERCQRPRRAR